MSSTSQTQATGQNSSTSPSTRLSKPLSVPGEEKSPDVSDLGMSANNGVKEENATAWNNTVTVKEKLGAKKVRTDSEKKAFEIDALTYLDHVKDAFDDKPDIYNDFLDVMKDFKAGTIHTSTVIRKVSELFKDERNLIEGFNSFLPTGYRIMLEEDENEEGGWKIVTRFGDAPFDPRYDYEARADYSDSESSKSGQSDDEGEDPSKAEEVLAKPATDKDAGPAKSTIEPTQPFVSDIKQSENHTQASQPAVSTNEVIPLNTMVQDQSTESFPMQGSQAQTVVKNDIVSPQPLRQEPMPSSVAPTTEIIRGPPAMLGEDEEGKTGPIEFNHAINYVNKIKTRFSANPETYKQFLEILQTYQRDAKSIQVVYVEVKKLFENAPDLLDDFQQFLPDTSRAKDVAKRRAEEPVKVSNMRGEPIVKAAQLQKTPRVDHRLPPVGNFAPTPVANKDHKRKRGDTKSGGSAPVVIEQGSRHGSVSQVGGTSKKAKTAQGARPSISEMAPLSPTLVPALPEPLEPTSYSSGAFDELGFFDRAKKTIGNKNTFNEFLKLCNLFAQDLIDKTTLVHRAHAFIGGNPTLFHEFCIYIKYEDVDAIIVTNRARQPTGRVMLSNCRGLGPSYRLLPKRERLRPCSGRDELCHSVLNDDWASHPTWASEDSGFIAHRKNVHEEGLHKIEEERHDYDFHIEACGRTIQLLEPYAQNLLRLPEKDREQMDLPPGIGGQSETIHKRIIMKIYGRDAGLDVFENLHKQPYAVIPILLNRLKQKHEEWKSAQREWEKVWRDQTQKIFWKSLDHQAVSAKQADKRQFQMKTLIGEIHTKYEEQKKQRIHGASVAEITKPQLTFNTDDADVIADASCLILSYADQYHSTEYPRLLTFIKEIIPIFYGLNVTAFAENIERRVISIASDDDASSTIDDGAALKRKTNGKGNDLRRGVLDKASRSTRNGVAGQRLGTPLATAQAEEDMSEVDEMAIDDTDDNINETWAEHPTGVSKSQSKDVRLNQVYSRHVYEMYANSTIYCFIRMFVILYERLKALKNSERDVKEAVKKALMAKPAMDLGLIDKQPSDLFIDVSPSANYYNQILVAFEDLIRNNDIDMSHIEDTLRRYYLQHGWQLYSIDKLLGSLVRFAISVSSDSRDKSWEMLQLFKKDRVKVDTTCHEQVLYRKQCEKFIKEGDVYRISFNDVSEEINMKVFKRDEPTFEVSQMLADDAWRVYINDYIGISPTHGVNVDSVSIPVLKRNVRTMASDITTDTSTTLPNVETDSAESTNISANKTSAQRRFDLIKAKEGLEFKVSVGDYKLSFVKEKEEYWHQTFDIRQGGLNGVKLAESTARERSVIPLTRLINNSSKDNLDHVWKKGVEEGIWNWDDVKKVKATVGGDEKAGDEGDKMDVS